MLRFVKNTRPFALILVIDIVFCQERMFFLFVFPPPPPQKWGQRRVSLRERIGFNGGNPINSCNHILIVPKLQWQIITQSEYSKSQMAYCFELVPICLSLFLNQ